jgi:hypothetical protein
MTNPFERTIKMETVKDEEGNDKVVWDYAEPGSEWARVDKDLNLVHLDMDLCAQSTANVYTALAIGVWNAAVKAEREACAKVCDDLAPPCGYNLTEISFWDVTSLECAAAIRARSNT